MKIKHSLFAALLVSGISTPAFATADSVKFYSSSNTKVNLPAQLSRSDRKKFADIFAAIQKQSWIEVPAKLAQAPDGLMKSIATAEYYLAANSPRVEMGPLLALLNKAPGIPQAAQLGRLAKRRGAQVLPSLPQRKRLFNLGSAPRRGKPRAIRADAVTTSLREQLNEFIKNDDPQSGEALVRNAEDRLSGEALTELRQRVAWSYYIENNDKAANRVGHQASSGTGQWAVHGHWVTALSAWRLNDCKGASAGFDQVGRRASNPEMRAAGLFWGARANILCGEPHKVQAKLQTASQFSETFYGILSAEALGMDPLNKPASIAFSKSDWKKLSRHSNVKLVAALIDVKQLSLADEVLRHQAQIGNDSDHSALLRLARELSLPRTQIWLAHNGPRGHRPDNFARYPAPKWAPQGGWRVDPALVFAHTLQESNFRAGAVSPVGARGLMQVRPGTARDIARKRNMAFSTNSLNSPSVNLEYGQSYLEQLRDMSLTAGLLPKIVAAYNAGPGSVQRWNSEIRDNGDPLLFMESIPYSETRAYVGIVLRNYWMYEQQAGVASPSLNGMAQGLWPKFPGSRGKAAIRMTSLNGSHSAD